MTTNAFGIGIFLIVAVVSAQDLGGQLDDVGKVVVGDMVMTRRQHQLRYTNGTIKRNGLINKAYRWPGGTVPVVISPQFNKNIQDTIKAAAAYISQGTCIRFQFDIDARSQPNHLNVIPGGPGQCNAQVGYTSSPSQLKLDPERCKKGSIIHELLHVLGFYHMQEAAERDNYIDVNFKNILPAGKDQFEKATTVSLLNTEYDYSSIMHYSPYAFAINPSIPTMTPKGGRQAPDMGQRNIMTQGDFKRVNRMYECRGH